MNGFSTAVNINEKIRQDSHQQATELKQQTMNIQKVIGCSTFSGPLSSSSNINNSLKPFNDPMNGLTAGSR